MTQTTVSKSIPDIFDLVCANSSELYQWIGQRMMQDMPQLATDATVSALEQGIDQPPCEVFARSITTNYQQSLREEQNIISTLCTIHNLEYATASKNQLPPILSIGFMRRWLICVIDVDDTVNIAASEPYTSLYWLPLVERLYGRSATVCLLEPRRITELIDKLDGSAQELGPSINEPDGVDLTREFVIPDNADSEQTSEYLSRWLLQKAFELNASDIHIETRRSDIRIRMRIDGTLSDFTTLPKGNGILLVSRLKVLTGLDITETRLPQDGRMSVANIHGQHEIRASSMPLITGEKLVLRIFDSTLMYQPLTHIFTNSVQRNQWQHIVEQVNGLVLVTGPTGSGKTTTLYSTLSHIYTPGINICTVENPVEMIDQRFNQVQVNSDVHLGFSQALQNLLRQDPDVIMIGEIRNPETANIAVQAALTGHLVLATLHTNDALSAITRMLDLEVPDYLLQSTLKGVLAQRLIRLTCQHCLDAKTSDCLVCRGSGFLGRSAIFEIINVDEHLRFQIGADTQRLLATIRKNGVQSLLTSGLQLVADGRTTESEIYRVCPAD